MTSAARPGLSLEVIWTDSDLREVQVKACNKHFSASVNVYAEPDFANHIAQLLRGFPKSVTDKVSFELGSDEGNSAAFTFTCIDATGHCVVCVDVRNVDSSSRDDKRLLDHSRLHIPCVASAVDEFLSQLTSMTETAGATAELLPDLDTLSATVW